MANVLGMKHPHALLRSEILQFDHSEVFSKGRRRRNMWHDDCDSDILGDEGIAIMCTSDPRLARRRLRAAVEMVRVSRKRKVNRRWKSGDKIDSSSSAYASLVEMVDSLEA
jgi:hypothetical protein